MTMNEAKSVNSSAWSVWVSAFQRLFHRRLSRNNLFRSMTSESASISGAHELAHDVYRPDTPSHEKGILREGEREIDEKKKESHENRIYANQGGSNLSSGADPIWVRENRNEVWRRHTGSNLLDQKTKEICLEHPWPFIDTWRCGKCTHYLSY